MGHQARFGESVALAGKIFSFGLPLARYQILPTAPKIVESDARVKAFSLDKSVSVMLSPRVMSYMKPIGNITAVKTQNAFRNSRLGVFIRRYVSKDSF